MAISENTRAAKLEESFQALQQSLQQSWQAFQSDIKNKLDEHHLRLEEQKLQQERQQAQQERVNSNLNELITGLSRQVMQMSTQIQGEGSAFQTHTPTFLDYLEWIFLSLMVVMYKGGFISVSHFLGLMEPLTMLKYELPPFIWKAKLYFGINLT